MAYRRFKPAKFESPPAKVAKAAKNGVQEARTLAALATLAAGQAENRADPTGKFSNSSDFSAATSTESGMVCDRFGRPETDEPPAKVAKAAKNQGQDGQTLAQLATLAGPPSENALSPIQPEAVRLAYRQAVARLVSDHARAPDAAKAEALDILRVELRRDPRLIPPQVDPWRCVTCGKPEAPGMPLLAVATNEPDQHRWMHAGPCHQRYRERLTEAVETVMTAAGLLRPGVVREAAE